MKIDLRNIRAEVYHESAKGVLYVKVYFPSADMWINSWTVRKSDRTPDELWVQPPTFNIGRRWLKVIEFKNDSQVFDLIRDEILRAVDRWSREKAVPLDGIELEGDEREKATSVFPD